MKQRKLGESVPTIAFLQNLGTTNFYKLDAFLEALVSLRTSEMIAAAWPMSRDYPSHKRIAANRCTATMKAMLGNPDA